MISRKKIMLPPKSIMKTFLSIKQIRGELSSYKATEQYVITLLNEKTGRFNLKICIYSKAYVFARLYDIKNDL